LLLAAENGEMSGRIVGAGCDRPMMRQLLRLKFEV
jgi:hypothetical protein